jgi:hypothetical protein
MATGQKLIACLKFSFDDIGIAVAVFCAVWAKTSPVRKMHKKEMTKMGIRFFIIR